MIGERKFIYDLWGDPVTMASRMARGAIEVKGRGRMETYLLGERIA